MPNRRPNQSRPNPAPGSTPGATVQLSADFLDYARQRYTAPRFKDELEARLLPTVPERGPIGEIGPGVGFGKFFIVDRLGRGGMAEVFLARDPERLSTVSGDGDGALVALKVMRPKIALDRAYVRRFIREAANTALIDHPNVVSVLEVGAVDGRLYFTMEQIQGETLKEHLAKGPMPEEEGIQVLCQLVDGLVAAHERGITHRDLKPANIMLITNESRYGFGLADEFDVHVKVTDFGLAQMIELDESQVTAGHFLGTAKYVAPEVVRGEAPTLQSDVYSLGVLAFQVFAGRAPFRARTKEEFVVANLTETPIRLDRVVPVSPDLGTLVDAMLEKDPDDRPTVRGLRRDLLRLAARRGREPIVVHDDASSVFMPQPEPTLAEAVLPRLRLPLDDPRVIVAAATGVLAAVLILGLLLLGGGDPPPLPPPTPPHDPVLPPDEPGTPPDRPRDPVAPPEPATPDGVVADPLGVRVATPPSRTFRDQLARLDFDAAMTLGDQAWRRGEHDLALDSWRRAAGLLDGPRQDLARRIRVGDRAAALRAGDAARADGDRLAADRAYRRGLAAVPGDPALKARLIELERERNLALDTALDEVRRLADDPAHHDEARDRLRALEPEARVLGRTDDLDALRDALGAR